MKKKERKRKTSNSFYSSFCMAFYFFLSFLFYLYCYYLLNCLRSLKNILVLLFRHLFIKLEDQFEYFGCTKYAEMSYRNDFFIKKKSCLHFNNNNKREKIKYANAQNKLIVQKKMIFIKLS